MPKKRTKKSRTTNTLQVRIIGTPSGPYVDMEPVYLGLNDEVEWWPAQGQDFTVDFKSGGPFSGTKFDKSNPHSGKPNVPSNPKKIYKYTITSGGVTIDPGVIIH